MDIRVAAYRPVTMTTFQRPGSATATVAVQNAQQSSPVNPVGAVQQARSNAAFNLSNYNVTDERGTRVNIFA